ncbi:MAG: carboxymuconolactone decarboxylase family protein [Actinomycetota bacterium]
MNTRAASAMRQGMDDKLYNSVQNYFDHPQLTTRERLAAEYAERFAVDHTAVDDDLWNRLRQNYTDPELLELTVTIGFCVGLGRAFQVLDVARDFDVLWSREPEHEHKHGEK